MDKNLTPVATPDKVAYDDSRALCTNCERVVAPRFARNPAYGNVYTFSGKWYHLDTVSDHCDIKAA